jgi:hypothetical protein
MAYEVEELTRKILVDEQKFQRAIPIGGNRQSGGGSGRPVNGRPP